MSFESIAKRYAATRWQKPVNLGSGTTRSVIIRTLDGRMELSGHTEYYKKKEEKGSYRLVWSVLDRWTPGTGQTWTNVPIPPGNRSGTTDKDVAVKTAEAWAQAHPLDAPMPGSWTALKALGVDRYQG